MLKLNLEMIPVPALAIDRSNGQILEGNALSVQLLGAAEGALAGQSVSQVLFEWPRIPEIVSTLRSAAFQLISRVQRADGRVFQGVWRISAPQADSPIVLAVLTHGPARPPTDSAYLNAMTERPVAAGIDYVTGLADRWALEEQVDKAFSVERPARDFGILFVDLDHFKQVNDRLGHRGGDRVLAIVAERLMAHVRPSDLVARYGGDEFVIYTQPMSARGDLHYVAERILASLREPIRLKGETVRITASIGSAFGSDADSSHHFVELADREMYRAKSAGGDRHLNASSLAPRG
jgi:diguanylate cyclase (GGDEF)-like protein